MVARREGLAALMAALAEIASSLVAFVGHFSIAVWLFNRLHAVALPRPAIKWLEKLLLLAAAAIVFGFLIRFLLTRRGLFDVGESPAAVDLFWAGYGGLSCLAAALAIPFWLIPKLCERAPAALLSNDTLMIDVAQRLGYRPVHGHEATFFASIPGNELLKFAVQRKTLLLPGLPAGLDGLTIAHLSDLHMTGKVGREYYDAIVDETNALEPDLIAVTGDIVEKEYCLPWIEPTLGRLRARHGKFFILGNHEKRLKDVAGLRKMLGEVGLTDVGGRCQMVSLRGTNVLVAGNELPWFGAAPDVERGVRIAECGIGATDTPHSEFRTPHFRLLLSHTPDQLPWARSHIFDLMLAGHNHGGQIRLPYLGALITPSVHGFRYAGGLYSEPPTLLHVSRGLGGIHPIRLNCPPELALLVLKGEYKPEA